MMRVGGATVALMLALAGLAQAAENFIPGRSYSPESGELPPLNSAEDEINNGADLIETELYVRKRRAKEFESRFQSFRSDQQPIGGDVLPDY